MAFDSLSEKLQNVFKNLRSKGRLTEDDVKTALKEVKMALLEADVNFRVVKKFVKDVQERAIGQDVMSGLNPGQMVIKIVNEEMVKLMGSETTEISLKPSNEISIIMMAGLQGAGKTTTLKRTISMLKDEMKIGVMEADIDSDVDAQAISETGVRAIQIHTGGMCHLDADMTRQGIREFGTKDLDFVVLENVGNLVCPAEFDTGSTKNAMILSVPEGDDKPLKYPLMFSICDVVLINKCDTLSVFDDFSKEAVKERILKLNPDAKIFFVSAKTGEGFDEWADWIRTEISEYQK